MKCSGMIVAEVADYYINLVILEENLLYFLKKIGYNKSYLPIGDMGTNPINITLNSIPKIAELV